MLYASLTDNRTPCRLILFPIILLIIQSLFAFVFLFFFLVFFSGRFFKPRLYGVPAKSVKTSTFSVNNPGFEEEHQYSEIVAEHHTYENPSSQWISPGHQDNRNSDISLQSADYQPLHVNMQSEPTYAALETESMM